MLQWYHFPNLHVTTTVQKSPRTAKGTGHPVPLFYFPLPQNGHGFSLSIAFRLLQCFLGLLVGEEYGLADITRIYNTATRRV